MTDCDVRDYFVYIMTNRSRVVLYVGMTGRLDGRVLDHRSHVVEGFTSKYRLDRLVYYEQFSDPISAITREKENKGWRRAKKNTLVETLNPKWDDLAESLFNFQNASRPRQRRVSAVEDRSH